MRKDQIESLFRYSISSVNGLVAGGIHIPIERIKVHLGTGKSVSLVELIRHYNETKT